MMKTKTNRKSAVTATVQRVCVGPLAPHTDRFAEFLAAEGYAPHTIRTKCASVADLSHWLKRCGLPLTELDEERVKQFHARHRDSMRRGDATTGDQLLEFLRRRSAIPSLPRKTDRSALGRLMEDYERFLSSQRGLAHSTVVGYLSIVRRFLSEHFANKALRFQTLRPADLHRFVLREARRVSRAHAGTTVTTLRSFLRFLRQRGAIKIDLAAALFGVAYWRLSHIPKSLPPEQVEQLLHSCDRSTPSGQRDYAILLLLARLGCAVEKCWP